AHRPREARAAGRALGRRHHPGRPGRSRRAAGERSRSMSKITSLPTRGGSRILSVGAARGDRLVPNEELVGPIDSSDEWIRQRTGIITRARVSDGSEAVDLAETAAKEAIARAGIDGSQL